MHMMVTLIYKGKEGTTPSSRSLSLSVALLPSNPFSLRSSVQIPKQSSILSEPRLGLQPEVSLFQGRISGKKKPNFFFLNPHFSSPASSSSSSSSSLRPYPKSPIPRSLRAAVQISSSVLSSLLQSSHSANYRKSAAPLPPPSLPYSVRLLPAAVPLHSGDLSVYRTLFEMLRAISSGMTLYKQELLPERRDVLGYGSRIRRGKKIGRITRRRCSVWFLLCVVLFLVYLSFFSRNLSFHNASHLQMKQETSEKEESLVHAMDAENITYSRIEMVESTKLLVQQDPSRSGYPKISKKKKREQYGPCEIGFAESVDTLLEPESYMNFTNFSLEYIAKEEKPYGNGIFDPRFGGHQTLIEREKSFSARNQTMHCGFTTVSENSQGTGFDLNEEDKSFMHKCKVVVSSCIFGSSDFLRRPTSKKISQYSKKSVCFVMFLDEQTMEKLSSEGQHPDDRGYIGLWRIVIVKNLPYTDMRKTGKVPKFLSHRLFPSSRFSIWIDSKMRLNADPMLILEYFLWRNKAEYAISNHYDRHCVWEEVLQNKRLNKYNHTVIDEQFNFYQSDGLTKFNSSDDDDALPSYVPEGSFIVRAHTPMSNLFSCLWFNEVDRFTSRDQLSFAFTYLKLRRMNPEKPFYLNMFLDCERRALAKLFHHRTENPPPAPVE